MHSEPFLNTWNSVVKPWYEGAPCFMGHVSIPEAHSISRSDVADEPRLGQVSRNQIRKGLASPVK